MYSPKIREDLISILYKLAKQEQKPMTELVDEMLRAEINNRKGQIEIPSDDSPSKKIRKELPIEELKNFLKGKYIIMDCGHRYCLHPLSNTFIMTAEGNTYCHECYD